MSERTAAAGPVTIVTAGSGKIGGAIARALAGHGHRLVLMSAGGSAVKLAEEIGGIGVKGSVTDPAGLKALVEAAMDAHGRIDGVVNNTGHVVKGTGSVLAPVYKDEDNDDLLGVDDATWHGAVDMILLNVVRMARLVTPIMQRQKAGAIVNISSFAQKEPSPKFAVGAAMRMAMGGFMKQYADRYARDGIRMNNLLPGFVGFDPLPAPLVGTIPMGRSATTKELGETAAFLLSPGAAYITGQSILLDGGLTRGV